LAGAKSIASLPAAAGRKLYGRALRPPLAGAAFRAGASGAELAETGMMATMTICFGILFMMLGVIAEYLHRIFIEAKNRPLYFIAESAISTAEPCDG
jgi:hypothetical protein